MKPQNEVKISNWAAHTTTGVSVTLALLTLGIIAMIWIAATSESRRLMEKIEISVVLADSVSDGRARDICDALVKTDFARDVRLITRQEALDSWKEATGEDLEYVFGVNPLSPEIAFSVAADYTSVKGIESIRKSVSAVDGVYEVGTPDSHMIAAMNANIRRLTLGFTGLAAIMLVISFVLINNTVRLSIYSKRFTIHTMRLVGATDGFIRRPFISTNTLVGAVSGLIAGGVLAGLLALSDRLGTPGLTALIGWTWMIVLVLALVAGGALICALAALLATTRHLRQDYGELFK